MTLVLKYPEINPDELIESNFGEGKFYVCLAGGTQEGLVFFYGDDMDQFFFFVEFHSNPAKDLGYSLEVTNADVARSPSRQFLIPTDRKSKIEHNIRLLFQSRTMDNLKIITNRSDIPKEIRFSWSISK